MSMGEPIDSELADAFADFLPRFKRWIEHLLPPGGPTAVRVRLLGMVHCEGPQKMSGLATALGITARRVTALADALEEEGLVARGSDPRDRRVTWITLTETGVAMVDRLYEAHLEAVAALFDELAPDRKAALLQSVRELSQRLSRPDPVRRGVGRLDPAQDTPTSASTTSAPSSPGSDHPPTRGSSPLPLHLGSRGQKLYGRTFRRDRRVTPRHRGRSHPWSR